MISKQPDPLTLEIFDLWTDMGPTEREQFIRRIRSEVPSAPEIADAFERHHRSLQARA